MRLLRGVDEATTSSYADLFEWLRPSELLESAPRSWAGDWKRADADTFKARATR